jgi:hypothetical protein
MVRRLSHNWKGAKMGKQSFTPAIFTVLLLGSGISGDYVSDKTAAAPNRGQIVITSVNNANCARIIKTTHVITSEDYAKIQEYLRRTDTDTLVVQSSPDNIPVVVPNMSMYSMPTIPPDMSKYPMPVIKPRMYKKLGTTNRTKQ